MCVNGSQVRLPNEESIRHQAIRWRLSIPVLQEYIRIKQRTQCPHSQDSRTGSPHRAIIRNRDRDVLVAKVKHLVAGPFLVFSRS